MSLATRVPALLRGRRPRKLTVAWFVAAFLLLLGTGSAAYAFWASTTTSNAAAAADALTPGSKPAVSASGSSLSVTWAGGTTVNGRAATGYTVTRYAAASGGTGIPGTGGCAGTVTTLSCTEQNVQGGIWYYTVTPAIALWTGVESPRSTGTSNDANAPVATVSGISPTPNTAGWNSSSPVTVGITADDGASGSGVASISYVVDGGAQQTVGGAVTSVPVSGDGTHTVSYFATDKVGNAGSARTLTVRIDTQAPAAPVLTVPAYVNLANAAAVPVSGTTEPGAKITLTAADAGVVHSAAPVTATADGSGNWSATLNLGSLDQGTVTYSATATDAAGNVSAARTASSVKDTVAPAAAQSLGVPAYVNIATASSVRISGTAETGATVKVSATSPGSAQPATGTATASDGTWSANLNLASLKDGTVTYTVTVTDSAGNTSAAATVTNAKDTVAPAVTITAPLFASGSSKVNGTVEAGIAVTVTVRDSAVKSVMSQVTPSGTAWSTTVDISSLADGTLTYTASATDAAGNNTTATASGTTTKDTVPPTLTGITGTNGNKAGLDRGDLLAISFSEAMDPAKFCPGWNGGSLTGTITLSNGANTANDAVSFTSSSCTGLDLGTVLLGADYVGSTAVTFSGNGNNVSTLSWDSSGKVLTLRFGVASGNVANPTQGSPSYSPPLSGLTDLAGNPLGTSNPTIAQTTF
ncbi:Ig-like domain-containing protein [Pseudarthrobacter chlorophenolicus]|uniref:Ig-like domain-containing protein n=1 Tax=Pseudarthrobacter chlorophenolicus TaxID=85085 RepID=UPI0005F2CDD1|nr:Ig-like domain-containing protein [Pseudarthrobacter chlorophenolicus]